MTERKRAEETKKERRLEKKIEIAAPVQEVWKALTDPKELVNWFPLEARVTPGVGGKIFLSWGPECEGEAEIVAWEPGKKFAWKENVALVEWTLEARGGKTVVRLVQSGFLGESDWEKEWFESTSYGWGFMLASLRWALERHRGEERQVAWPRVKASIPREEAYRRLMSAGGLFVADARANLKAGEEYALRARTGESLSGRVEFVKESRGFCLTVREMKDALLWLTIEGEPGKIEVQVWLSAFGLPEAKVKEFSGRWEERLRAILAA
ncbi:MAG TPA: SRPBCC domain-containing protein [Candidatus Acidoferrum sp.]|nr:SRPBCC domain-containing protein [Candidatus Acidoferrum sp.]